MGQGAMDRADCKALCDKLQKLDPNAAHMGRIWMKEFLEIRTSSQVRENSGTSQFTLIILTRNLLTGNSAGWQSRDKIIQTEIDPGSENQVDKNSGNEQARTRSRGKQGCLPGLWQNRLVGTGWVDHKKSVQRISLERTAWGLNNPAIWVDAVLRLKCRSKPGVRDLTDD